MKVISRSIYGTQPKFVRYVLYTLYGAYTLSWRPTLSPQLVQFHFSSFWTWLWMQQLKYADRSHKWHAGIAALLLQLQKDCFAFKQWFRFQWLECGIVRVWDPSVMPVLIWCLHRCLIFSSLMITLFSGNNRKQAQRKVTRTVLHGKRRLSMFA